MDWIRKDEPASYVFQKRNGSTRHSGDIGKSLNSDLAKSRFTWDEVTYNGFSAPRQVLIIITAESFLSLAIISPSSSTQMPRLSTSKASLYHSQFTNAPYPSPSSSSSPPQSPASSSQKSTKDADSKKKHQCQICERAFSTSGHLARHTRVHTGERNHKCPFPGCDTRCSRQDNLQQQ